MQNDPNLAYTHTHAVCDTMPMLRKGGVFWCAIWGGAIAAVAVVLILMPLGAGMGFAAISPWSTENSNVGTFTAIAAIWLIIVQWLASGLGGYITGRLRTRWTNMHAHEGFFRDTAHGFLTWALAAIIVTIFTVAVMPHDHMKRDGRDSGPLAYDVDRLYRTKNPNGISNDVRMETERLLTSAALMPNNNMASENAADDRRYLAQLVSSNTGLSMSDSEVRVNNVVTDVKSKANMARKAASALSFYSFFAMLVGAFIACVAAALGGMRRDSYDDEKYATTKYHA